MLSRRSTEINHVSFTNVGEDVFYGGEQDVFISVEMGLYPFPLHNSPKSFSDVEVWGIGREIEYVETPVLPSLKAVLYLAALVYGGVVENHNGLFRDSEGEVFHEFDKLVGVYVFGGREAVVSIVAVYHSEDVEPAALVNRHTEILIFEFPCIRHISFGAYMTFISVIQINESRFPLTFKLLQEFLLISVLLRRGCPFGRFSYTSKSCAIKDKKFLKAPSLICFPVASSQAALALETLWRCFRMASLTASLSFLVLIMRFRPFPGLFLSPAIPSDWNLLTQCITRWYVCPARAPAAALLSPSALPNTIRHRIRNEWVEPFRYPFSRAVRCSSLIFIFVACLDIIGEISICKTITFENGFHCINSLIKHTYIIRVRAKSKILNPVFAVRYMNLPEMKEHLRKICRGAVNQANINSKEMASIPFLVPPIELQNQYALKIEAIEEQKRLIESSIADLETLLASRMDYWFNEI